MGILIRIALVVLAGGAALTAANRGPAPTTPARDGRISVAVSDDTGAPVEGARVFLAGRSVPVHRVAESDRRGAADFAGVAAGEYVLAAEKPGLVKRSFGQQGSVPAIVIALGEDETFTARIQLPRTGGVAGIVTDESGRAVVASVKAHQIIVDAGRRMLSQRATTLSNRQGAYKLEDLVPGEYVISAQDSSVGEGERDAAMPVPIFYPSSSTAALATSVRVTAGDDTSGINFQLQTAKPARISGLVLDDSGQPASGTVVHLGRGDDILRPGRVVRTDMNGGFQISLVPGTYRITAASGATAEVVAMSGATVPITVTVERGAIVSGRVEFAGTRSPGRLPVGAVVAELVPRDRPFPIVPLRVDGDREWTLRETRVPPGEYGLRVSASFKGWSIDAVSVGDRLIGDQVLRVGADDRLDGFVLTLVDRLARLTGSVVDRQGATRYDHRILVFSNRPEHWTPASPRIRLVQPDTNGRFVVDELPAGDYLMAAIEGLPDSNWDRPLLEAAAASAVRVTVPRSSTVVQNVMVGR